MIHRRAALLAILTIISTTVHAQASGFGSEFDKLIGAGNNSQAVELLLSRLDQPSKESRIPLFKKILEVDSDLNHIDSALSPRLQDSSLSQVDKNFLAKALGDLAWMRRQIEKARDYYLLATSDPALLLKAAALLILEGNAVAAEQEIAKIATKSLPKSVIDSAAFLRAWALYEEAKFDAALAVLDGLADERSAALKIRILGEMNKTADAEALKKKFLAEYPGSLAKVIFQIDTSANSRVFLDLVIGISGLSFQ